MELFLDALGKTDVSGSPDCAAVVQGREPLRRGAGARRRPTSCARCPEAGRRSSSSRTSTGPTPRASRPSSCSPSPTAGRSCSSAPTDPDGLSRRHPAADLLPRLDRRHLVTHVQLGRLGPAEVNDFLAAVFEEDPPYRAVEALHSRTGGNPFFLEELVAGAGDLSTEDLASAPLPWTVAEAVRRQVDGLDPDVRAVVSAMSVLGRRVAFDLLAAVTAEDEERADRAPAHRRRRRPDRRGRRRRVQLPPRPRPRGDRGRAARPRAPAPPRSGARRHAGRRAATTTSPSPTTPRAPAATTRWWPRLASVPQASLRLGSTYQALQLAETGLCEADDDLDLRALATEAAAMVGLLDDAAEHGDQWLAAARAQRRRHPRGPRAEPAHAHRVRPRRPPGHGALHRRARRHRRPGARRRGPGAGHDLRRPVAPPPRPAWPLTCEWADKALGHRHARTGSRRCASPPWWRRGRRSSSSRGTAAEGRALLEEAADEAARTRRRRPRRPGARTARVAGPGVEPPRRRPAARSIGCASTPRSPGSTSWPTYARVEATASLAAADGDLDAALEVLEQRRRDDPRTTSARNRRWLSVLRAGLALEAGDLRAAAELTEAAKPVTPRSQVGVFGLDVHLAARQGDLDRAREQLARLIPAMAEEGYAAPSQVHDLLAGVPRRRACRPTSCSRSSTSSGVIPGHRLDADHPFRQLIDAQLAEGDGDIEAAARLLRRRRRELRPTSPFSLLPRHRGTAHVGAARCLIALGSLDDALPHAEAAAELLSRWRGWRVDELVAVQRRLGIGSEPTGPPSSRLVSGRSPRSSPRASATPGWPSGSTSPRGPRPCTCRTSCRSSAWRRAPRSRPGRPASGSPTTAEQVGQPPSTRSGASSSTVIPRAARIGSASGTSWSLPIVQRPAAPRLP